VGADSVEVSFDYLGVGGDLWFLIWFGHRAFGHCSDWLWAPRIFAYHYAFSIALPPWSQA